MNYSAVSAFDHLAGENDNSNMFDTNLEVARQGDETAIADLVDSVYREYGDRICLSNADKDLTDLKSYYFDRGGSFVVLKAAIDGRREIVGAVAALPITERCPRLC